MSRRAASRTDSTAGEGTALRRILAVLLAGLLAAGAALAQPAATPATKKELVQKLLQIQRPGLEAMARTLAEQPAAQMAMNVRQLLQTRVPPERREAAGKAADAEFRKYLDEAVPLARDKAVQLAPSTIGALMEERFSEQELRQLIEWMDSPLNRKFQQMAPELQNALAAKLIMELRPQLEPKAQAMDAAVARALGLPPRPAAGAASAPAPARP